MYILFNTTTFNIYRGKSYPSREAARRVKRSMRAPKNWKIGRTGPSGAVVAWVR